MDFGSASKVVWSKESQAKFFGAIEFSLLFTVVKNSPSIQSNRFLKNRVIVKRTYRETNSELQN